MKRIKPDVYFVVCVVLALLADTFLPVKRLVFCSYNLWGILFVMGGLILTYTANATLYKNHTTVQPFKTPRTLVTSGPFKFSRNPVYLGMSVMIFGMNILLGSVVPVIFTILFIVIINRFIIPGEEKILETNFEMQYLSYKKAVRRWV